MDQIRPFPPTDFIDQAEEEEAIRLIPAVDLKQWVVDNFLTLGGGLHNPDHDHIAELLHDDETFLAFAWASSAAVAKKRMVLGQCEKVMFNQGGWKKARQEQQMRDWFGFVPVYLITIDASFCENSNDVEFCRLIEHELYHIGVERDEDGEPICSDVTGLPKHYLAGHDVEVFFGETKRWGADANVKRLLEIAKNAPFVSEKSISACCGTCVIN
ncbi:putative metallopeptidase [Acinetobacter gerneri]|uniref:Metallopeptidase n=1 Tax=Acinetobacter gerneri TaxID=202952 RepID=A0AAW8JEC5_9GAMM|nr:putative metallopeptidase [Acinetobacter gerneri]MDQ9009022.1 putative metallopeptidase [Acinetobacter gerneri]MDQ9013126.1 putative metallopeptidase [Acinetobacter gerneri]MDQ9024563.1 putative metallopeptidase [Acinetobacter gerneri]MDQ9051798.1 putative metallopeptidase [Acinetobacter gerneri]MDQ9059221.1 putative metallopeptidase [Acinetobacter gerneri]